MRNQKKKKGGGWGREGGIDWKGTAAKFSRMMGKFSTLIWSVDNMDAFDKTHEPYT